MRAMSCFRQVFFVGGFDPKSARHYHRIYREAARRCPSGRVDVGPRETETPDVDAWNVTWHGPDDARPDAPAVQGRYHVLRWDDIVRRHWGRNLWRSLSDHWRVYGPFVPRSLFARVRRTSPAAFYLALVPLALSAGTALVAVALTTAAWQAGLAWPWAVLAALGMWLAAWRGLESRIDSEWLLRLYAFSAAQVAGEVPELDARVDRWADAVLRQLASPEPGEEVLVVGHSTGCLLAILVMDRVLQQWRPGPHAPRLALLTLGHCVPILTWHPQAARFRSAVERVQAQGGLSWLDVSAPTDWASFCRVPPWTSPGTPGQRLQCSPRWHETMDGDAYQRLLQDRQALHLHYLRSPDRLGGYDPVVLTAGPTLLHQRLSRPSIWSD